MTSHKNYREQYDLAESSQHCVEQGTEQFKISFHDAMRMKEENAS